MSATLRMHAYVPDPDHPDGSHAWLSVEKDGITTTYGLQGDSSPHVPDEQRDARTSSGEPTNLYRNCDQTWADSGQVLRETPLNPAQLAQFEAWADQPHDYSSRKNNCAHAARDGWAAATGEHFDVGHEMPSPWETGSTVSFDCPAGLAESVAKAPPSQAPPNPDADFSRPLPPPPPPPPPEQGETKTLRK